MPGKPRKARMIQPVPMRLVPDEAGGFVLVAIPLPGVAEVLAFAPEISCPN